MKYLTIFRHAEAEHDSPSGDDMDRALTRSGVLAARAVASRLIEAVADEGVILTSAARRARETAGVVCEEIKWNKSAISDNSVLYNASENELLNVARSIGGSYSTAIIIGHNPTVSVAANQFCKGVTDGMKPADAIVLAFAVDTWSDLAFGTGKLTLYVKAGEV